MPLGGMRIRSSAARAAPGGGVREQIAMLMASLGGVQSKKTVTDIDKLYGQLAGQGPGATPLLPAPPPDAPGETLRPPKGAQKRLPAPAYKGVKGRIQKLLAKMGGKEGLKGGAFLSLMFILNDLLGKQEHLSGVREENKKAEMVFDIQQQMAPPEEQARSALQDIDLSALAMREAAAQSQTDTVEGLKAINRPLYDEMVSKLTNSLWGDLAPGEVRIDGQQLSNADRSQVDQLLEAQLAQETGAGFPFRGGTA